MPKENEEEAIKKIEILKYKKKGRVRQRERERERRRKKKSEPRRKELTSG